jgi:hypothetical protein
MADIKQAAKWMQEGKKVRRTVYGPEQRHGIPDPKAHPLFPSHICADEHQRLTCNEGLPVVLLLSALLADDWEIAE